MAIHNSTYLTHLGIYLDRNSVLKCLFCLNYWQITLIFRWANMDTSWKRRKRDEKNEEIKACGSLIDQKINFFWVCWSLKENQIGDEKEKSANRWKVMRNSTLSPNDPKYEDIGTKNKPAMKIPKGESPIWSAILISYFE